MESLLVEIGWKRADLARRLKVSKNVPTNWGKQGPPDWVAEYLQMLADIHRLYSRYLTPDTPGSAAPSNEGGEQASQAKGHGGPSRAARLADGLKKVEFKGE